MTKPIGWLTCSKCNVTQPLTSMKNAGGGDWCCIDEPRCETWASQTKREREDFARRHPELTPMNGDMTK